MSAYDGSASKIYKLDAWALNEWLWKTGVTESAATDFDSISQDGIHVLNENDITQQNGPAGDKVGLIIQGTARNGIGAVPGKRRFQLAFGGSDATGLVISAIPQTCLLYTSPSPRDRQKSRMPSSA